MNEYEGAQPRLRESANKDIQTIGKYGCYFLCLCQIAGLEYNIGNILKKYLDCLLDGCIGDECYVKNAEKVLFILTGEKWTVRHSSYNGRIICFLAANGQGTHFTYVNERGELTDTETRRLRQRINYRECIKHS